MSVLEVRTVTWQDIKQCSLNVVSLETKITLEELLQVATDHNPLIVIHVQVKDSFFGSY